MILRAEKDGLIVFDREEGKAVVLPAQHFTKMIAWLNGESTEGWQPHPAIAEAAHSDTSAFLREMERCESMYPPDNAYAMPLLMNLELTTRCPLRCPQCYCDLHRGKDLPISVALNFIAQATRLKIPSINLSGGETMVYPHLYELIEACAAGGLCAAVALSGYGFDKPTLDRLTQAGVSEIYISLNGSTNEVNSRTRDGYDLAIGALGVLHCGAFARYAVNWVAHRSNIEDFENVLALCNRFDVKKLVVLAFKPDSAHSLSGAPTTEQLLRLAQIIKEHTGTPDIVVESCFSPLKAYLAQRFFGNCNRGIAKGCGAGRDGISVDVDGNLTPCRHLDMPERFERIEDYWLHSKVLQTLRAVEDEPRTPCAQCRYDKYCLHCMAINAKLNGEVYKGNETCGLWKPQ